MQTAADTQCTEPIIDVIELTESLSAGPRAHAHAHTLERPVHARHTANASDTRARRQPLLPAARAARASLGPASRHRAGPSAPHVPPQRTVDDGRTRRLRSRRCRRCRRAARQNGRLLDQPPVASLSRRSGRPMKDEPTARWPPAGLGAEATFPHGHTWAKQSAAYGCQGAANTRSSRSA